MLTANEIRERLGLVPLPEEGGYYRETYRAALTVPGGALPGCYGDARQVATAIYYLVTPDEYSALHRLPSDEVFHFYMGDPVAMLQIPPGGEPRQVVLGSDLVAGHQPQVVVPGNVWQGTRLVEGGQWALLGCTVSPGFDFRDFAVPDPDELASLSEKFSKWGAEIARLSPGQSRRNRRSS